VEYLSAAAMAQQADEHMRLTQFIANVAPLTQMDPRYKDRVSEDDVIEALHATGGVTARVLRSREDADRLAQQRAEAAQQQAAMQMAQQGAGAMRDVAGAMGMMGGGQ
jgi:hypothetical protein